MSLLHFGTVNWCKDVWWVYGRSTSLAGALSEKTCYSRTRKNQIRSLQLIAFAAHSLMSGRSISHVVETLAFIRWVQLWEVELTTLDIRPPRLQPIPEKATLCMRCSTVAINLFLLIMPVLSFLLCLVFITRVSLTQTKKITVNVCGYLSWPFVQGRVCIITCRLPSSVAGGWGEPWLGGSVQHPA